MNTKKQKSMQSNGLLYLAIFLGGALFGFALMRHSNTDEKTTEKPTVSYHDMSVDDLISMMNQQVEDSNFEEAAIIRDVINAKKEQKQL